MPKVWARTIDDHRRQVSEAILAATSRVVADEGLLGVTMSRIAEEAGIGRATLYKYFSSVTEIVTAWHERQVEQHVTQLHEASLRAGTPTERLRRVLTAYAESISKVDAGDLSVLVHRQPHVMDAERRLREIVQALLVEARGAREIREDVSAQELTTFCLHALSGASRATSRAAARRLVALTMDGLDASPRPRGN